MADITLRALKGSPLTIEEIDTNFISINTDLGLKLYGSDYNKEDVFAKVLELDGPGSGLDADTVDGYQTSVSAVVNTIPVRNPSGNLIANSFVGSLIGPVIGNVTGNLTGNVTGNVSGAVTGNVTGNIVGDLTGNVTGSVTGSVTLTGTLTTNASVGTAGQMLISRGAGLSPQWSSISSAIGTVGVANGGTGLSAPGTSGNYLVSNGTSWVSQAPPAVTISTSAPTAGTGSNKDLWFRV